MFKEIKALVFPDPRIFELYDGLSATPPQLFHPLDVPEADAAQLREANMEILFGDLPRLINPLGVDDTDKIRNLCVKAFPELYYCPDQVSNRRKLYMAIYRLRMETKVGWQGDRSVKDPLH